MKLQEVLSEYRFNNVGQFRGIAESLGYKEEYNRGELRFTRGEDEEFRVSIDKIRSYTKHDPELEVQSASMDRISQFFNRNDVLSPEYKDALSKEGVSIINWGDLKDDSKDRFTVIDHKNKICYTGKELYSYALENGYLLDGRGTQLEKGVLSDMMDINGKSGKIRLTTDNKISVIYRKEALIIPDRILGKKLSDKQQQDLIAGKVAVLSTKKGDIFLQVDKDLNAVVVRSEKELSIPAKIGGYDLTPADKYLLANNHTLDNLILRGDNGYFIADVSMNTDKKGYAFANIQTITEAKAKELLQAKEIIQDKNYLNDRLVEMQKTGKIDLSELKDKRYDQLIQDHFSSEHKEYLSYLKNENPDKDYNYDLEGRIRLKSGEMLEKEGALSKGTTERELREEGFKVEQIREQYIENEPVKDLVQDRDLEQELKEAVARNDFEKMSSLKDEGYRPTEEIIKGLGQDHQLDQTQAIVIEKLFGIKPDVQKVEETQVKEAKAEKVELNTEMENKKASPELDSDFKAAVEKGNFEKLSQLKEQGYQPSKELIQSISETVSSNTMIAVHKIFDLKPHKNLQLGDVKLAHNQNGDKDISRPIANTINRAFSDL